MPELVFEVVQESDGGYCAECLTESIFTEADTCDELRKNVLEATSAFFFDRPRPDRVRLHLVRDETLLVVCDIQVELGALYQGTALAVPQRTHGQRL